MNIGEISAVSQDKINTFNTEAAQYHLAREGGWRQSRLGGFFIPIIITVLVGLHLTGK